jgi:hypothetical protein
MNAIETDLQIGAALGARFEPAGAAGEFVFAAAVMAMTGHQPKFQNSKPEIQTNSHATRSEYANLWNLELGVCLRFGIWDLEFIPSLV